MWPRPIIVLRSRSAPISQRMILPLFLFLSPSPLSFFLGLCNSFPLLQSRLSFLSPPTPPALSVLLFHSFIFYCLNSSRQSHPIEPEPFLIIIVLSASICIPLAFLPLGIYFYLFLLHPELHPLFLPPLSWCLPVFPLTHVHLIALPLLVPNFVLSDSLSLALPPSHFSPPPPPKVL